MSVIVKNMRMPETCIQCPLQFGGWCYVSPPEIDERVAPTVNEAWEQKKPKWCPLEEQTSGSEAPNSSNCISRQTAINALAGLIDRFERILADIRESKVDDTVCGMCEYDGAYLGQSGDWCNECPGFDKDNCFKLSDSCRKRWMGDIALPSAQPEQKKGEWKMEPDPYGFFEKIPVCSECGHTTEMRKTYNFCPNCGADMRGEMNGQQR